MRICGIRVSAVKHPDGTRAAARHDAAAAVPCASQCRSHSEFVPPIGRKKCVPTRHDDAARERWCDRGKEREQVRVTLPQECAHLCVAKATFKHGQGNKQVDSAHELEKAG